MSYDWNKITAIEVLFLAFQRENLLVSHTHHSGLCGHPGITSLYSLLSHILIWFLFIYPSSFFLFFMDRPRRKKKGECRCSLWYRSLYSDGGLLSSSTSGMSRSKSPAQLICQGAYQLSKINLRPFVRRFITNFSGI